METPPKHATDADFAELSEREPPWWSPSRLLRMCTGAREDVLTAVPSDRAKYTSLGGVVLGTALIAMLSMSMALYMVFGRFEPFIAVAVPVWGLFVLSLDRWLISTTFVSTSGQALRKLVPRLLLSIALGVIVAEPLLLGVYHTAIEERVAKVRQEEIDTRGSDLRLCNPVPGTGETAAPLPAKCNQDGRTLPIQGASPDTFALKRDGLQKQLTTLRQSADADAKVYADLEEKARRECNGTPGPGLTGRFGQGPNCARLRQEATRYHDDHLIDENQKKIVDLNRQLTEAEAALANARDEYKAALDQAIEADLNEVRQRQGRIGLLERFRTLDDLVSENRYVGLTQWALRILFIIIDALPVILKILSGTTAYDRMLASWIADQERVQQMRSDVEMERRWEHTELLRHHIRGSYRTQRELIDQDRLVEYANLEEHRGKIVDAYENHLMRVAIGPVSESWDPSPQGDGPYIDISEAPTRRFPPPQTAGEGSP